MEPRVPIHRSARSLCVLSVFDLANDQGLKQERRSKGKLHRSADFRDLSVLFSKHQCEDRRIFAWNTFIYRHGSSSDVKNLVFASRSLEASIAT